jgi:hypothetical protein
MQEQSYFVRPAELGNGEWATQVENFDSSKPCFSSRGSKTIKLSPSPHVHWQDDHRIELPQRR